MAVRITTLLDPSRITLSVQSRQRIAAINEVALLLKGHPDISHFQGFYDELLAREIQAPTCLGNELAIPHSRTEHVNNIVLAVGRSSEGVLFENANQTVRLLFVLGTPQDCPTEYLIVVSTLCKILKNAAHHKALLTAPSPEAFISALIAAEEKLLTPAIK